MICWPRRPYRYHIAASVVLLTLCVPVPCPMCVARVSQLLVQRCKISRACPPHDSAVPLAVPPCSRGWGAGGRRPHDPVIPSRSAALFSGMGGTDAQCSIVGEIGRSHCWTRPPGGGSRRSGPKVDGPHLAETQVGLAIAQALLGWGGSTLGHHLSANSLPDPPRAGVRQDGGAGASPMPSVCQRTTPVSSDPGVERNEDMIRVQHYARSMVDVSSPGPLCVGGLGPLIHSPHTW